MRIIAFSRTTNALLAGQKTVTRREWSEPYYLGFRQALDKAKAEGNRGLVVAAWSNSPHRGGKRIGEILVTSITWEPTRNIPDSDYEAEGFAYMDEFKFLLDGDLECCELWKRWQEDPEKETAVIRFEPINIPEMMEGL